MNQTPLVTILLPVYNGEKTLKATLASLLKQTFTNFEIIIGIDGTKDKSKDIALSFKDPRIKIIEHPKNLGLADNLNVIISKASNHSLFYAMAEQDDIYVPERLQWEVDVMHNNSEIGLVSGIAKFIGNTKNVLFPGLLVHEKQFPEGEDLFKFLYVNQLKVVNTCMMWRKEVHKNHDLSFHNTYGNFNVDWDFVLRFSLLSKVYGIQEVLVEMNRKESNISVTTNKKAQFDASRALIKNFKQEFNEILTKEDYNKALKMHQKIELGYMSKIKLVLYAIYYTFLYQDIYFLKYISKRLRKYFS